MGKYTKKDDENHYKKCKPYFLRFILEDGMGCPQIAKKLDISYCRVSMLFSKFIREYSDKH